MRPRPRDEGEPSVEPVARDRERRQPQRLRRTQLGVGEHRVRHVGALGELDLILERLRREARDERAEPRELLGVVAERTRLGRAAARAGNSSQPGSDSTPGFPVRG